MHVCFLCCVRIVATFARENDVQKERGASVLTTEITKDYKNDIQSIDIKVVSARFPRKHSDGIITNLMQTTMAVRASGIMNARRLTCQFHPQSIASKCCSINFLLILVPQVTLAARHDELPCFVIDLKSKPCLSTNFTSLACPRLVSRLCPPTSSCVRAAKTLNQPRTTCNKVPLEFV